MTVADLCVCKSKELYDFTKVTNLNIHLILEKVF